MSLCSISTVLLVLATLDDCKNQKQPQKGKLIIVEMFTIYFKNYISD